MKLKKFLNNDYLPQTDVCKKQKNLSIYLQLKDPVLLINKLGQNNFDELYSNLVSKYSLVTNTYSDL